MLMKKISAQDGKLTVLRMKNQQRYAMEAKDAVILLIYFLRRMIGMRFSMQLMGNMELL